MCRLKLSYLDIIPYFFYINYIILKEISPKDTIKIDFYSFGKTYTEKEKLERIEQLADAVEFEKYDVKVCLNNKLVKHRFVYFEDWIHLTGNKSEDNNNNNMVDGPLIDTESSRLKYLRGVYFGKYVRNIYNCGTQNEKDN